MQAVMGTLNTGIGYKAANSIFGILDISFISNFMYKKIENYLSIIIT